MTNLDKLRPAAEAGDIDFLYALIKDDPSILADIDSVQFVETPLHIAASRGHLRFAIEIMNLKPSFALKLNPQGFSPIHLAMQYNQKRMVLCFVDVNKDLVRVKGREGITPLHFASRNEEIDLLAKFLRACQDSIEDVTVGGETALHIAVKNNNYKALELLVWFLMTNYQRGARKLEYKILNWKDEDDNTILHILAQRNFEPQVVQALGYLLKTRINVNTKNLDNKTALDMAVNVEIKSILLSAGAKLSSQVTHAPTFRSRLTRSTYPIYKMGYYILRMKGDISEEQRNTWMIVATLVATATYQSALSPPGGVYQANASENNVNIASSNSSRGNTGKSVLSGLDFFVFSFFNMSSFLLSILGMVIMMPRGLVAVIVTVPVGVFTGSYLFSMWRISPTHVNSVIFFIVFASYVSVIVIDIIMGVLLMLKRKLRRHSKDES